MHINIILRAQVQEGAAYFRQLALTRRHLHLLTHFRKLFSRNNTCECVGRRRIAIATIKISQGVEFRFKWLLWYPAKWNWVANSINRIKCIWQFTYWSTSARNLEFIIIGIVVCRFESICRNFFFSFTNMRVTTYASERILGWLWENWVLLLYYLLYRAIRLWGRLKYCTQFHPNEPKSANRWISVTQSMMQ